MVSMAPSAEQHAPATRMRSRRCSFAALREAGLPFVTVAFASEAAAGILVANTDTGSPRCVWFRWVSSGVCSTLHRVLEWQVPQLEAEHERLSESPNANL
ncbi:hypothetical protein MRX96_039326 [Rhipicephalus microplus]